MRRYMPKVGGYGLEMMFRTCTVQVNLDFSSEADMVKKFRVGLALQPVATALFANSPFREGRPNGFLSYRSQIWTDVDNARSGMLPFVFESGFGFEQYVDYALDVPMYFVYRDGKYIDVAGKSFRDFLDGSIPELKGIAPTMSDWADHLTTIFPEVRLKKFLEMRGADGGAWRRICGLPALWVGIYYDQIALDAAWDMVKDWTRGRTPGDARCRADAGVQDAVPRPHGRRSRARDARHLDRRACAVARRRRIRSARRKKDSCSRSIELVESRLHARRRNARALQRRLGSRHGAACSADYNFL